jgi:hypothetical protein
VVIRPDLLRFDSRLARDSLSNEVFSSSFAQRSAVDDLFTRPNAGPGAPDGLAFDSPFDRVVILVALRAIQLPFATSAISNRWSFLGKNT